MDEVLRRVMPDTAIASEKAARWICKDTLIRQHAVLQGHFRRPFWMLRLLSRWFKEWSAWRADVSSMLRLGRDEPSQRSSDCGLQQAFHHRGDHHHVLSRAVELADLHADGVGALMAGLGQVDAAIVVDFRQ